jgi:hypothetical protein
LACPTGKTPERAFLRDFRFGEAREVVQNAQNNVRAKSHFASNLKARHSVQSPAQKYSASFCLSATALCAIHSTRGRIAIVTDAGLDAMDGSISQASGIDTCGQAVWF